MPAMPRAKGKAKKIAYKIMGVPQNMKYKPSKRKRKIDRELLWDETLRVR